MTNKRRELQEIEENDSGIKITDGSLIIPIVLKLPLYKMCRTILIPVMVYGLTYFADAQSPIYAVYLTIVLVIIEIIFS